MNAIKPIRGEGLPSVPEALRILNQLEKEVGKAETFLELKAIADRAAAFRRAFTPLKDVASHAGAIQAKAVARIGVELAKQPKAPGARGGGKKASPRGPLLEPRDLTPTLAEMGVHRKLAAQAQKLAALGARRMGQLIAELSEAGKPVAPTTILAAQRRQTKRDKVHAVSTAVFSEDGPFGTVVIDPPWRIEKIDREVRPNQDAFDYPTMSEDEIVKFWGDNLASRIEADTHLFMWATQKHLPAALRIIGLIGFRYVLTLVWHKPGGFQPIGLPQYNCEFAIHARKGSPEFVDTKDFDCCFSAPRREHSRKPDEVPGWIVDLYGDFPRLEAFARTPRPGWDVWGKEVLKFAGGT